MIVFSRRSVVGTLAGLAALNFSKLSFAQFGGLTKSLTGAVGSVAGGGLFDDRSLGETYVGTSRLIHLTTREIGGGIVAATKALGIKEEKDIPQYLLDVQTAEVPNAFTGQIKEQDTKVIEYSSEASNELKNKLSGDFTLSDESKIVLAEAYQHLEKATIFQDKSQTGAAGCALKLASSDNKMGEATTLGTALNMGLDPQAIVNLFTSIGDDISSLFGNIDGVFEVSAEIKKVLDNAGVEVAKKEMLEESANTEVSDVVLNDLEKFAS